jgi:predicted TPR repeat methyltransferase
VDIRLKLGDACRDNGDTEDALREFEEILRTHPQYMPGRVHYGIALYSAGRKQDAVKAWEDVLKMSPGHRGAEMYLNLVKDGKDAGKAEHGG